MLKKSAPEMNPSASSIRNISDTARWVAYFRARETRRPDALFRDPFAERLCGELGPQIAATLPEGRSHEWAWVTRTYLFDQFISRELREGTDLVLNLAAGLDARPYRMDLPSGVQWIEVDLPGIIRYKNEALSNEKPRCLLQRVSLDLADMPARQSLLDEVGRKARRISVLSEGLLIYFTSQEVETLARDLAAQSSYQSWIIDLASPGQLEQMQNSTGAVLGEVGAAFKFGPPEGPNFFRRHGWIPVDVQGLLSTAAELKRAPKGMVPFVAGAKGAPGNFPWTGVCRLKKQ